MSSGPNERRGPSLENLQKLSEALPGYVETIQSKVETERATLFRKICKICCVGFDKAHIIVDTPAEPGICKECQKQLDDGCFAVVWNLEYAFLRPMDGKNQDMAGQIHPVGRVTMEKIKELGEQQVKQRDAENRKKL